MRAITIRRVSVADAASIAEVHVSSWQTTYRGIISVEYLDDLTYEKQYKFWLDILTEIDELHFVYLAEDEQGKVIGFVAGGPERDDNPEFQGELYSMYIIKDYQGKGVGTMLFRHAIKELIRLNMPSMILWVLTRNPYRKFYEKMGGKQVSSRLRRIGNSDYEEIAYGWQNLSTYLKLDAQISP